MNRVWRRHLGERDFTPEQMPACCRRAERGEVMEFECPDCGAWWLEQETDGPADPYEHLEARFGKHTADVYRFGR